MINILHPCPKEDLPQVWDWLVHFKRETLDTKSPQSLDEFLDSEKLCQENGGLTFGVFQDKSIVGAVWIENIGDGIGLGHLVFDPGHILTTLQKVRCTQLVLREVLKAYRKVMWTFFADNRPFHIFLKRLGAVEEGTFHQHVKRDSTYVDQAWMASFPETNETINRTVA